MSKTSDSQVIFLQHNEVGDILFPFTIESDILAQKPLVCSKQLRSLPGKRLACQANYAGTNTLVKIFFGPDYQRRWSREVRGVGYIHKAGIRTPRLLESGVDRVNNFAVAIFEFIDNAKTLEELRQEGDLFGSRIEVFKSALSAIAKMHEASIYQQDIHLDNFLTAEEKVYLIDGDQVHLKKGQARLSPKQAIDNLAMFFTQLYPWQDEWIDSMFDCYLAERKSPDPGVVLRTVKQKLQEHRAWREKKYITKKVFRVCSAFNVIKNWRIFCVFSRELRKEHVIQFIDDPDLLIKNGEVLKSGRTATVAKINFGDKSYIVKRYNRKNFFHQFARSLKKSRSAVSWRNGHLLQLYGIPTAKPLLMLERRIGPMRGISYVVTEYLTGLHASDYFQEDDSSSEAKEMAKKIVKLVQNLHQCRFSHGDLKAYNIWITGNRPILIDLDGMRKINGNSKKLVDEDWSRLRRDLGDSQIAGILFKQAQGKRCDFFRE